MPLLPVAPEVIHYYELLGLFVHPIGIMYMRTVVIRLEDKLDFAKSPAPETYAHRGLGFYSYVPASYFLFRVTAYIYASPDAAVNVNCATPVASTFPLS